MKKKVPIQKPRYRNCRIAVGTVQEQRHRVQSSTARKVDSALRRLKLPRLADVESAFFSLTDKLGTEHEGRGARRHRGGNPLLPSRKKNPARKVSARPKLRPEARSGDKPAQRIPKESAGNTSSKNPTRSRAKKRST